MEKFFGQYYIYNGEVLSVSQTFETEGPTIYEVIRARQGHLSFADMHYERFLKSAEKFGFDPVDKNTFMDQLKLLLEVNKVANHNTKIVYFKMHSGQMVLAMFLSLSIFPSKMDYEKGIISTVLEVERQDPNVKTIRGDYISKLEAKLKETGAFEVIIVNDKGYATEGGRTNIFAVFEETVYTPPKEEVLVGIIRTIVISICQELGIPVVEKMMKIGEFLSADAIFFTGTGKDVLPIAEVDEKKFDSANNKIVRLIIKRFNEIAEGRT